MKNFIVNIIFSIKRWFYLANLQRILQATISEYCGYLIQDLSEDDEWDNKRRLSGLNEASFQEDILMLLVVKQIMGDKHIGYECALAKYKKEVLSNTRALEIYVESLRVIFRNAGNGYKFDIYSEEFQEKVCETPQYASVWLSELFLVAIDLICIDNKKAKFIYVRHVHTYTEHYAPVLINMVLKSLTSTDKEKQITLNAMDLAGLSF